MRSGLCQMENRIQRRIRSRCSWNEYQSDEDSDHDDDDDVSHIETMFMQLLLLLMVVCYLCFHLSVCLSVSVWFHVSVFWVSLSTEVRIIEYPSIRRSDDSKPWT